MKLVIEYLCKKGYIKEKEKNIYLYGLHVLILNLTSIFISWMIAVIFKNTFFGLLFLLCFTILRVNLGGYHCKTSLKCMLSFSIINIIINLIYLYTNKNIILLMGIITSSVLLINNNPIKNNKKASKSHIMKSKQMIKIIISFYIFILIISILFSINIDTVIISMSLANTLNFILHYLEKIRINVNEKKFHFV